MKATHDLRLNETFATRDPRMDLAVAVADPGSFDQGDQRLPDWTRLQDTLQSYVLPQLSARGVVNLRSACKAFQAVVDQAPVDCILPAVRQYLPDTYLAAPADSQAAQERLRCHAAHIESMFAGNPSKVCSTKVLGLPLQA